MYFGVDNISAVIYKMLELLAKRKLRISDVVDACLLRCVNNVFPNRLGHSSDITSRNNTIDYRQLGNTIRVDIY